MDENTNQTAPTAPAGKNNLPMIALAAVVGIAMLGGAGWWFLNGQTTTPAPQIQAPAPAPEQVVNPSPAPVTAETTAVKEFTVTGSNFSFDPKVITVKTGDKVRITFKNSGGNHNWVLDEFNAQTKTIRSGEQDVVEFTASKAGTFEYYCSVANHRAMGMVGKLVVE